MCFLFPVISSYLTPVAVKYLLCSSSEGWVPAMSAGKITSIHEAFGRQQSQKDCSGLELSHGTNTSFIQPISEKLSHFSMSIQRYSWRSLLNTNKEGGSVKFNINTCKCFFFQHQFNRTFWKTVWSQEPDKIQEGTGYLGSYQEYMIYHNSQQLWKEYIIHFTVLEQFLTWCIFPHQDAAEFLVLSSMHDFWHEREGLLVWFDSCMFHHWL